MTAIRLPDFDQWQPGYGSAIVSVYLAGTTTLASIYSNEALSTALDNPQTLNSLSANGIDYGKWAQPIYVGVPVYLSISTTDATGVIRPAITTLDDEDASLATVQRSGGSIDVALEDIVARSIHIADFGEFKAVGAPGVSAATNNTTLVAAIGEATSNGGGEVIIPAGTYPFTSFTLPTKVVLRGDGPKTTILQSSTGAKVVTVSGDRAGLRHMALDGVSLVASSIGLYAKAVDQIVLDDVEIKRFATGMQFKGGRDSIFRDFFIDGCTIGAKFHGDEDAGDGANGDEYRDNRWIGGRVSNCITTGIDYSYEDLRCRNNAIQGVGFEDNLGTAIRINGAQSTRIDGCWWSGNTINLEVLDDSNTSVFDNHVIGLTIRGGVMNAGEVTLDDTCQDIMFDGIEIQGVEFTLTGVTNSIILRDCTEDADVVIAGESTKLARWYSSNDEETFGTTSGNTATKAWAITLQPGQIAILQAMVVGNQQNGTNRASYHRMVKATRAVSTLAYDTQTGNFTVGDMIEGATSGATARLVADSDSGATGTLSLRDIIGEFVDNEIIIDEHTGSATVNGALVAGSCTANQADTLGTDYEAAAAWACAFAANGPEVELRVQGDSGQTVDWTVRVLTVVG